jgi:DNA-binding transcriptional regulator GbsR (MarR family)
MSIAVEQVQERFINQWGNMVDAWGLNKTMGQIHALLYITGQAMTADEIMDQLNISRGNVSMNLRELMNWGVVRREHRKGDRKQYFVAEEDPWRWFKNVVRERRKREVEPIIEAFFDTLTLLDSPRRPANGTPDAPLSEAEEAERAALQQRLKQMLDFVQAFNKGIDLFLHFSREDFAELMELLTAADQPGNELARQLIAR